MRLNQMLRATSAAVAVLLSSATAARAESIIVGTVLDAETQKPLVDVIVTATSPALKEEQVLVTDAQGQYRIPELPPGVYTLRFDKEAFLPFSRPELRVQPGRSLRVNVTLVPHDYPEPGVCEQPTINTGSTATETSVDPDFIQHLALNRPLDKGGASRSFESLAELAPGARSEAYGVSINGASPFENAYVVDGLSTSEPVLGINALPLSVEFLLDTDILTGGYMPQYGHATGGIIQVTTRSGSDAFHGSVFGNWVPGALGAMPAPASGPSWTVSGQNKVEFQGDLGATLGGPLVKDRLWFFAGVAPAITRVEHTRPLNASTPGPDGSPLYTPIPGTSQVYPADERGLQAMGKLTYLFNPDHEVSLSVITTPTHSDGGADRLTELDGNATLAGVHYNGAFMDKRMLVEAHLGWFHQTIARQPTGGTSLSSTPLAVDGADRYQANAHALWFLELAGTHVLKAGMDAEHLASEQDAFNLVSSGYTSNLVGGFVQDSWTLADRLTLNAGLRYDTQWLYTAEGARAFVLGGQLSPRLGLVLDPLATGRMKLFAHYGKYRGQMPLELMNLAFPSSWNGPGTAYRSGPVGRMPVAPDLALPSSSELVAGAEYEVLCSTVLSATYTHRSLDSVIEDLSRDDGNTFFLGNPGTGLASNFPKAERTHDAVTVAFHHRFSGDWLAQASYTWSRLYGNYAGPFRLAAGWGEPLVNGSGPLPDDRTHTLKLFGARQFQLTQGLSASIGLSYQGRSGTPIPHLPWVHTLDSNLGVSYQLSRGTQVSLTLEVFNLFNFQEVTRVSDVDPEFEMPTQYQTPRQVRLGLRYTF